MQQKLLPEKERSTRHKAVTGRRWTAKVLAFAMAVSMLLSLFPPMSARAAQCMLEEHTHSAACYGQSVQINLICDPVRQAYADAAGEHADFVVHTHNDSCYVDGEQICDLEEIAAHTHTDDCYGEAGLHVHNDDCYMIYGKPQCGQEPHSHGADCYAYACGMEEAEAGHAHTVDCYKVLVCQETAADHAHSEDCYTLTGKPNCGQKASAGHVHNAASCGQTLVCELDTTHKHTQDCYQILICQKDTTKPDGEKELICDEEEIILHTHGAGCFVTEAGEQSLICEQKEIKAHVHSEACISKAEGPSQEPTCGLEEHVHGEDCEIEEEKENDPEGYNAGESYPEGVENVLEKSGFIQYWRDFAENARKEESGLTGSVSSEFQMPITMGAAASELSDAQTVSKGGTTENSADSVKVSKTIDGTVIENVFDITLTVESTHDIRKLTQDPDMAVVILMDISGTMLDTLDGSKRKLTMAAEAAAEFVKMFAQNNTGASKIGLAAFNSDAFVLKGMQSCVGNEAAGNFNASMGTLLDQKATAGNQYYDNEKTKKNSFTNIEGGLQAAYDMLSAEDIDNKNKYIVFLSDGIPTTYTKSGYEGYDPYTYSGSVNDDGVFYDDINNRYCPYGTNYSDKGAILAANLAATIKRNHISIYPIGIGLNRFPSYLYSPDGERTGHSDNLNAKQLIQNQIYRGKNTAEASTVDCYNVTSIDQLEVMKPGSFIKWLETKIGSGWTVRDINDVNTLISEYNKIFSELIHISEEKASKLWIVEDPVPADDFELLGFFDKSGSTLNSSLTGSLGSNREDTISASNGKIKWNLQQSGYSTSKSGSKTIYQYAVTYRVRLKNNEADFISKESKELKTNGTTSLKYATSTTTNGVTHWSDEKNLNFKIPSVKGYLGELTFTKKDNKGNVLPGAQFTLSHSCTVNCRGNNTKLSATEIPDQVKTSGNDGVVTFTNIPSGHTYTLTETKTPHGYNSAAPLTVEVKLDKTTIKDAAVEESKEVQNQLLETDLELGGIKHLTNPNGAEHSYSFTLTEVDSSGNPVSGGESQSVTTTWEEGNKDLSKTFTFPEKLHFTGLDLKGKDSGVWYYQIAETGTDSDSLDKDERVYTLEVTVSIVASGNQKALKADITKVTAAEPGGQSQEISDKTVSFTNTLLGALSITKELTLDEGSQLPEGKTFTISIMDKDGNPLAEGTEYTVSGDEEVKTVGQGGTIQLPAGATALIEKLNVGEIYTVVEDEDSGHGFGIYYEPIEVMIEEKTEATPSVEIKVTNKELTVDLPICGTKELTNPNGAKHTYTFTLTEVDSQGNTVEGGVQQTISTTWEKDDKQTTKTFAFPKALHYSGLDLEGEDSAKWYYRIAETGTDSESLDKDERVYTVEVTVSLVPDGATGRNKLTAEITKLTTESGAVEDKTLFFSNTLLGALSITKELKLEEGSSLAADRTFTVYITDSNGDPMPKGTAYTISGKTYQIGDDGSIQLPGNKTAVIEKLVVGDIYNITEEPTDAYGYTVSYDPGRITIQEKTEDVPSVNLKVVNQELTTDLLIPFTKTVENPDGDKHTFAFSLIEADETGKPINGGVKQEQSLKFKDEQEDGAFTLDYKGTMLEGYADGVRTFYYLVEETTKDDGKTVDADETKYLVEVTLTGGDNALTAEITEIQKITADNTVEADGISFTNTLLGSFKLTKQIIGSHSRGLTFEFTLKANLRGSWNAKLNGKDITLTFENGAAKVHLGQKDTLIIDGIPHGTQFTVTEKRGDFAVKVSVNGGWSKNGPSAEGTVTTDGLTMDYKNYSPDGLPQTGQLIWPIPILLTVAVLGIGGAILIIRKKGNYEK